MDLSTSTVSDAAFRSMLATAQRMGKRDGAANFDTQYLPGGGRDTMRDAKARAQRMLDAIEAGDPEVCDGLVTNSPLSGEWADSPSPRSVADAVGFPYNDENENNRDDAVAEIAQAYEWGWTDGQFEEACRHLRSVAKG